MILHLSTKKRLSLYLTAQNGTAEQDTSLDVTSRDETSPNRTTRDDARRIASGVLSTRSTQYLARRRRTLQYLARQNRIAGRE